jgi:hypothetical protein
MNYQNTSLQNLRGRLLVTANAALLLINVTGNVSSRM